MVELNPRRKGPHLFVQVSVAVISGAAAMYFIQSFRAAAVFPAPRARSNEAPAAAAPAPADTVVSSPSPVPDGGAEPSRVKMPLAPSSMMIKPEPGVAGAGIVSVGSDEPPPARPSFAATPEAAAAPRKGPPRVHLEADGLHAAQSFFPHDFRSSELKVLLPAKRETAKARLAAVRQSAPPPLLTHPLNLDEKGIPEKAIFVPSILHPDIVPEKPFWDADRTRKTVMAGLIALFGILYLIFAMGWSNPFVVERRSEDEPKR